MKSSFFELNLISSDQMSDWLFVRSGETHIGEEFVLRTETDEWKQVKYHVLGITEDIGPVANAGKPGARNAFSAFVSRFLNVQSNSFLNGKSICLHGTISPVFGLDESQAGLIEDLDTLVVAWTKEVISANGVPIVVGGGHNNAYGLIKGVSLTLENKINVVNMDPHADTRALGVRHSGNPFSYAFTEGYIDKYSVIGLHESYNNQYILSFLEKMKAETCFFEAWLDDDQAFTVDVNRVAEQFKTLSFGLELDMDAIQNMPSSAYSPSGITVEQARIYVRKFARLNGVKYLHLPEAAPITSLDELVVGKTLAYLVTDFIKCHSNQMK